MYYYYLAMVLAAHNVLTAIHDHLGLLYIILLAAVIILKVSQLSSALKQKSVWDKQFKPCCILVV